MEEKECNLDNLLAIDNPYGFRDFDWDDFKYDPETSSVLDFDLLEYRRDLLKKRRQNYLESLGNKA